MTIVRTIALLMLPLVPLAAQDAATQIDEAAQTARDTLAETTENAAQLTDEAASELNSAAESAAQSATEQLGEATAEESVEGDALADQLNEGTEAAKDGLDDLTTQLEDSAEAGAEAVKQQVSEAADTLKQQADQLLGNDAEPDSASDAEDEPAAEVAPEAEAETPAPEPARLPDSFMPLVSGFRFDGLDPTGQAETGTLVWGDDSGLQWKAENGGGDAGGDGDQAETQGWLDRPLNRVMAFGFCKLVALSAVLGWPFIAFVMRGTVFENERLDPTFGSKFFSFVGWLTSLTVLLMMGGLWMLATNRPDAWPGAPNLQLSHVLLLTWVLVGGCVFSVLGSIMAWGKPYWRVPARLHYSLVTFAALAFLWILIKGNVLPSQLAAWLG